MNEKHLTYQELLQIVQLIKSSTQFSEFHLKTGEIELDIKRADAHEVPAASLPLNGDEAGATRIAVDREPPGVSPSVSQSGEIARTQHGAQGNGRTSASHRPGLPQEMENNAAVVSSPMVGTCYRAPNPNAAPFVEVGAVVQADTIVCIIEVMKLMNSIPAGVAGTVTHILVDDGEPVEFGQPLVVIAPTEADA